MNAQKRRSSYIDVILVVASVLILSFSVWTWINALPIPKEMVFLATTIAVVISLVLVVNVAILVVLRLQRRVTHLEDLLTTSEGRIRDSEERVLVVTLSNVERRVINRLEESGGQMAQDELRRTAGLSKSTLSVALSSLERKSLVSRQVSGKTKIVVLDRNIPQ